MSDTRYQVRWQHDDFRAKVEYGRTHATRERAEADADWERRKRAETRVWVVEVDEPVVCYAF